MRGTTAPRAHLGRNASALALGLGLAACVASDPAPMANQPPERTAEAPVQEARSALRTAKADRSQEKPAAPVLINAIDAPPAPSPIPAITIASPRPDQAIPRERAADFEVQLQAQGWPAKGGGRLHVVLDNRPFKAVEAPQGKLRLGDIAAGAPLQEGRHVLVAFPADEKHLALQPAGRRPPAAVVAFWIGPEGTAAFRATDPLLVFNLPAGTYSGPDADAIHLDFHVLNADLGPGKYSVHATVTPPVGDARSITIHRAQPFQLVNLPGGQSRVHLELRDPNGVIVPGPWNSVDRTITVQRAPSTEVSRSP